MSNRQLGQSPLCKVLTQWECPFFFDKSQKQALALQSGLFVVLINSLKWQEYFTLFVTTIILYTKENSWRDFVWGYKMDLGESCSGAKITSIGKNI
jgi:hypothetical protein